jgi:hypothetical protein
MRAAAWLRAFEESAWAAACAASVRDNAAGCACPRSSQARLPETAAALLRPTSSHTAAYWAAVPLLTTAREYPHDPRSLFQVQQVPSLRVPCRVTCIESWNMQSSCSRRATACPELRSRYPTIALHSPARKQTAKRNKHPHRSRPGANCRQHSSARLHSSLPSLPYGDSRAAL